MARPGELDAERAPRVLVSGVVLAQPMGGVRRHNAELLPRLAALLEERGGELALLEGTGGIPFALPESVRRIPSRVPPAHPVRRALLEGRALEHALAEARASGRPFELVHTAHLPVPRLSAPLTLTLHDLRSLDLAHSPFSRRLFARSILGRALAAASGVFTVSEHVRARLLDGWPLAPERVRVVPNAADHLDPLPRESGGEPYLLHVGHLEPRKNLGLLVAALARDPALPPLVLAGRAKGDARGELERLARELGVAGRVRFLGPFDDAELPRLYARAACVVLPSHLEGFGICALEAQRARAPLAVSDTPALREVAGEDVPCFAPDDPDACARAIARAQATPAEILERHAERAERFRWRRSAELWLEGLLAARAAGPPRPPRQPRA